MHSRYTDVIKKGIVVLLCIVIAAFLAIKSEMNFTKVIVAAMIVYAIASWKFKRISNWLAVFVGLLLCVYTGRYFMQTLLPIREKYDATRYQQLTQISTAENWENSDVWISPIVSGKTADLTYADEWCHAYFEEFAGAIQIAYDKVGQEKRISSDILTNEFFELNEHRFSIMQDFFEDELINQMLNGEVSGQIFVAAEGMATCDTVYVMTDDVYNVYLMPEKILEKVLGENEE